ncbi:MAG: relaxase [Gammaproteobacteria bacterium]|jgi:hypothetical protein|nr:relaxase [Gammaproteobacteria bacterium]
MILHGNQRGGAKDLALHLLKQENEHVEVHELRGFVSDNLVSALKEIHAVSRGTKAKQFLFSLSLNPPPSKNVPTTVFEEAIERIEKKLGLTDQPRAIVFHEKQGRRYCHAVWSRIDALAMKAIPLSFSKRKLMDVSRELYLEHDWTMPRGLMHAGQFDPKNFTLAQWQQAKRIGKDPKAIKKIFQNCWAVSDNQAAFAQALKEYGYTLARGDRRGFVALDHRCEVFAVPKWVGIRTKEARSKLTDQTALPSVDEAREEIARTMIDRLGEIQSQHSAAMETRLSEIEHKRVQMARKHARERESLQEAQDTRWKAETLQRQARFRKGLRGLFDRLGGQHRRIKKRNEQETYEALKRDQKEKDALIFQHLDQRRVLQARMDRLRKLGDARSRSMSKDRDQYQEIREQKRETARFQSRTQPYRPPGRER